MKLQLHHTTTTVDNALHVLLILQYRYKLVCVFISFALFIIFHKVISKYQVETKGITVRYIAKFASLKIKADVRQF